MSGREASFGTRRELLLAMAAGAALQGCRAPARAAEAPASEGRPPAGGGPAPRPGAEPPAEKSEAPASTSAALLPISVPLVYDDAGGLFVEALVAGRRVRMILDTGASRSTISTAFATEIGLTLAPGDRIEGSAGVVESSNARAVLEVDGIGRQGIDFAVYGFTSYDPDCVGILGHEFLSRAPFRVLYREQRLEWNAPAPARTIPMRIDGGIPRIAVQVDGRTLELRLDTGAALAPGDDAYVNLTRAQADALGLTGEPAKVFRASGTGGATLELAVHRLRSLEVALVALPRAWAILQPEIGYFARDDAVGFLGNAALDKLDPWLDYGSGRFGAGEPT